MVHIWGYFISFFIEAFVLCQYSSCFFTPKHSTRTRYITVIILYCILFLIAPFDIKVLNAVLYSLANFIFFVTQYHIKWYIAAFHSIIITAIMSMCELFAFCIINQFVPHFFIQADDFYHLTIFIILSKLLLFSIVYIITFFYRKPEERSQSGDKSTFLLIFVPLTTVFSMLIFVGFIDNYNLSDNMNKLITIDSLFLLFTNLLIFGLNQYHNRKNTENMRLQLLLQKERNQAEYYEMLREQSENQRILIHDIKKHLQSINTLSQRNENEKVCEYINQLVQSSDLLETTLLCDHEGLNSILCRYKQQGKLKNITFHTDIRSGTMNFIAENDLTAVFCNLLDNAFEATESIPNAYIELSVSKRDKSPLVVITVTNSCQKNPFSASGKVLSTSKANKISHGFGIKSIQKTIEKYGGRMQMYYDEDTCTFHTIITLLPSETAIS